MIVMKFGGSSVQNKEAINRVIAIINSRLECKPLVVVSALSRVTRLLCEIAQKATCQNCKEEVKDLIEKLKNRHLSLADELLAYDNDTLCSREEINRALKEQLIELCDSLETFVNGVRQIGELSQKSEAKIVSTGELLSSTILTAVLNANSVKTKCLDARKMLVTDSEYLKAKVDFDKTNQLIVDNYSNSDTSAYQVLLTQGFISSNDKGETTLLGFEGSDYTAAIIASALDAERVEIWTDVDGIRTSDPSKIANTRQVEKISYEEAAEMAYLGARVLHPLTIRPTREKNIPIYVLNSQRAEVKGSAVLESSKVPSGIKSIAFKENIDLINVVVKNLNNLPQIFSNFLQQLKNFNLNPNFLKLSHSCISCILDSEQATIEEFEKLLAKEFAQTAQVDIFKDRSQVSLIGSDINKDKRVFTILSELNSDIHALSLSSEFLSYTLVLDRQDLQTTLDKIHRYIF